MKILRLRLANYRGIDTCEVHFRPTGVTVVVGPNEAGKTSLAEAIALLFDNLDSSSRQDVRAVKPVHRDAGPEIELEAESGQYHFVYFKRFLKRPETSLVVTRPVAENFTGREAHQRAESILEETLDTDLWRALLVTQGQAFTQAKLADQAALTAALDRASGGSSQDPRGDSLHAKVSAEVARYWTDRGGPRKDWQDLQERANQAAREVDVCRQQIAAIDQDIVEFDRVSRALQSLGVRSAELRKNVDALRKTLREIEVLEVAAEKSRLKAESLGKSAEAAAKTRAARADLIRNTKTARESLELAGSNAASLASDFQNAQAAVDEVEGSHLTVERDASTIEAVADLRRRDAEYLQGKIDLELLDERRERVESARVEAAKARETLARNRADDKRLVAIDEAERAVTIAGAKLDSASPSIRIKVQASVRIESDGKRRTLREGTEETIPVPEEVRLIVPGSAEITVAAGTSTGSLQRKLAEARVSLASACSSAGVDSPAEARRRNTERHDADAAVARLKHVEKADLRDLTWDELLTRLSSLTRLVKEYPGARPSGSPQLPRNLDAAKSAYDAAREELRVVRSRVVESAAECDRARKRRDRLQTDAGESEGVRRASEGSLRRLEQDLDKARREVPDEAIEEQVAQAQKVASDAAETYTLANTACSQKQPEKVRELLATEEASLGSTDRQIATLQKTAADVRRRLDVHGEAGLHERLLAAEGKVYAAQRELAGLERRAKAAQLLLKTLTTHRDAVRKAYVGPLQIRIEALGRILFDQSFAVEIDGELRIASRTQHSVTVPFDSLSAGTREQLSLIARVACAQLVAAEGGPLLLDDVLGFTDPERLHAMGAILRIGGQSCQIVLLTSDPDRYAHVGDVEVVRLPPLSLPMRN